MIKSSLRIVAITLVITQMVLLTFGQSTTGLAEGTGDSVPRAEVTTERQFIDDALDEHNLKRRGHLYTLPLTLSDDLCRVAQAYANKLAANDEIELIHSNNGYGENLYWSADNVTNGTDPVKRWYSEGEDGYNFNLDYQPGTSNFTQMLWRATKQMGIAKATGKTGTYVVANYNPRGNIVGEFKQNVFMD